MGECVLVAWGVSVDAEWMNGGGDGDLRGSRGLYSLTRNRQRV